MTHAWWKTFLAAVLGAAVNALAQQGASAFTSVAGLKAAGMGAGAAAATTAIAYLLRSPWLQNQAVPPVQR